MKKFLLALTLALCVVLVLPALASASTPSLKKLAKAVTVLQKKVRSQAATISSLSSNLTTAKQAIASQGATIAALQTTVAGHTTTLTDAAPLLAIAPYVTLDQDAIDGVAGPNIVFQGANVHVRSSSSDWDGSGLGNLIVGWDVPPNSLPSPYRTGSNNLVVGEMNNFTSFSCFVDGYHNTVSGTTACITGGSYNTASGSCASVSGGVQNTASSDYASVSGGAGNTASAYASSVSGGQSLIEGYTDGWATNGYEHH
jgi:hypothetical protein